MKYWLAILLCLCFAAVVSALPTESEDRQKRDVLESMKTAWTDVVKTLSDAGDAVVNVFKPTEKSIVDKIADGVKGLAD
ncbi:jg6694 [Pararge aegeria aegeria]|uniref:Jg6694 protein n=1 Tax=Pararge aegeria aegeria TaxID=348720 RepID=A0A8S4SJZ5_9NEOP|nr:jg6694 [Pararge aegeria aegeria]